MTTRHTLASALASAAVGTLALSTSVFAGGASPLTASGALNGPVDQVAVHCPYKAAEFMARVKIDGKAYDLWLVRDGAKQQVILQGKDVTYSAVTATATFTDNEYATFHHTRLRNSQGATVTINGDTACGPVG